MGLPLLSPLCDLLEARAGTAGIRAAAAVATLALLSIASGFLVSAGLFALTAAIGFPRAALVFAALFAVLALAVHVLGRVLAGRRAVRVEAARSRAEDDIALATALARSAKPLLPLAAFVTAFALARRP